MRRWSPILILLLALPACRDRQIRDDAAREGLTAEDFPALSVDVLAGMDPGVELSEAAVRGRNTWVLWTAGSQVFVDWLARQAYGISDTLKMLDSRRRSQRFQELGLVNEPGFTTPRRPDRYGLWLDVPEGGAELGRVDAAIAAQGIDPRVYGRSTGVFGLRLFPNPEFDDQAARRWDPDRYYDDSDPYSRQPDLVRPYRVGMTCGLCHVALHPLRPPADPNRPDWENLASALGNQYFREGRVFASNLRRPEAGERSSFLWEMLEAQPPGTSDTSRIASDQINNPNAINAIFQLDARLAVARQNPEALEEIGPGARRLPASADSPRFVPHVLKDGADSVGVPGAAARVYVNIGLFSQYWLTLHQPLLGIRHQQPFEIATAQRDSVYWRATEARLADLGEFLAAARTLPLENARWTDADGRRRSGAELLADPETLRRGGRVFARTCAGCHSSKRPPAGVEPRSEAARAWFQASVAAADFRTDNFLSEDRRHPLSKIGTNACRALATNAKRGRIWDNFSSESYKRLPAAESIRVWDPITGAGDYDFDLRSRGVQHSVGYYRTPSLVGVWSSAPLLHTNSLGAFTGDPSVEGRLAAFDDAMEKLLWPERRPGADSIWRTRYASAVRIPMDYLPAVVRRVAREAGLEETDAGGRAYVMLGPIPAGTPVNLLASLDLRLGGLEDLDKAREIVDLALEVRAVLAQIRQQALDEPAARELMRQRLVPLLMERSNCPDLVPDRGHEFGADLPDEEKRALIEYVRTL